MDKMLRIIGSTSRFFSIIFVLILIHFYLRPIFENPEASSLTGTRQIVLIFGVLLNKSNLYWVFCCLIILYSIAILVKDLRKNKNNKLYDSFKNSADFYREFLTNSENFGYKFNPSIGSSYKHICHSSDLEKFLSIRNGQPENSDYVFRQASMNKREYYRFLPWAEIHSVSLEIGANPLFKNKIDSALLHFAVCENGNNPMEYSSSFAISQNNEIYKCYFNNYSMSNIMNGIGQIKINSSLKEFLEAQFILMVQDEQINYKMKLST